MPSSGIKPASIALFPTAADRSTLTSAHQYYLSPPLTPYPRATSYNEQSDRTSPVTSSYQPSLPVLQEMLPNETKQRRPSIDTPAHNQHSAPPRHSERDTKETVKHSPSSTYHAGQHPTDPVRLMPLYSAQPHNAVSQPPAIIPPVLRRNKAHVASACVNCKKAHLACDASRPCRRCVSLDKQDSCVDVQHKRRGRPRLKDSAPAASPASSEHRRPAYLHRHVSDNTWKLQSTSYPRDSSRREYHGHHSRSFSQGSQTVAPRHHPYANPTPPTSAYAIGTTRNTSSYFDLPSPLTVPPAYGVCPSPISPNYYPHPNSQYTGAQQNDMLSAQPSSYQKISSARNETQFSGSPACSQPLLPLPECSPPSLLRRGSFPTHPHQSESSQYSERPVLHQTGLSPVTERRRNQTADSVKLPSLKDLGVPLR